MRVHDWKVWWELCLKGKGIGFFLWHSVSDRHLMLFLTWSWKSIVHKVFLRCIYLRWCWALISKSTSPHQSNFQSSATSFVFAPQNVHAHQWDALLIVFTMHACMLVEAAWTAVKFFSNCLIYFSDTNIFYLFFGYFDPINVFFDNKIKQCSGWPKRYFG